MAGSSCVQGILRKTKPSLSGGEDALCPNSIFLSNEKQTTFGRTSSSDTNIRLRSIRSPLMISRKHASINCENGIWTIVDHNSLNGVYVNGQEIAANVPHKIKPGDRICFGVAIVGNVHEFDYTFDVLPCTKKRKLDTNEAHEDVKLKTRKVLGESEAGPSRENTFDERGGSVADNRAITACKIKEAEQKIEGLRLLLEEKEKAYQKQLFQKEKELAELFLEQKNELEQEKEAQETCLMVLLEDRLKEKEVELSDQLEQQKAILLAEKEAVEKNLILELNRKLEEKDKELTQQLETQRDRLEDILQHKVAEQTKLQDELQKNKIEREKLQNLEQNEKKLVESLDKLKEELLEKQELLVKQQDVTKQAQEMAKKALVEQMEDEFSCIICQELFIQATTLSCSHSFCNHCLKTWLKKKASCPICRTNTSGTFVRSVVLDSAVEKIVATMDDETRQRWQNVCQERKEMQTAVTNNQHAGNQGNPIVVQAGNTIDNDVQIVERPPRPAIVPHARQPFYPGGVVPGPGMEIVAADFQRQRRANGNNQYRARYASGHCYICGMRGHWARTCPFR